MFMIFEVNRMKMDFTVMKWKLFLVLLFFVGGIGCNKNEKEASPPSPPVKSAVSQNLEPESERGTPESQHSGRDAVEDSGIPTFTTRTEEAEQSPISLEEGFRLRAEENPNPGSSLRLTPGLEPRDIMERMVEEYKSAKSYGDLGLFQLEFEEGEPEDWICTFAYEYPNLVRMEVLAGQMVCNGEYLYGQIYMLDGQVLQLPAPDRITISSLYPDRYLMGAMDLRIPGELFLVPPQVVLLFAKDPLKTLIPEGSAIRFESPDWIEDVPCDRITVEAPAGTRTYWIDRETFALLRVDLPYEMIEWMLNQMNPEQPRKIRSFRLELSKAALNPSISDEGFQIQFPGDAQMLSQLLPWSDYLVGKKIEPYESMKIRSPKGNEIPLSQYSEKVNVLLFWNPKSPHSVPALENLASVYEKYKEDSRLQFIAVCWEDEPPISVDEMNEVLRDQWKIDLPACQLLDTELPQALHLFLVPNLVVLAPDGIVARYFPPGPVEADEIETALKEVLEGNLRVEQIQQQERTLRQEFERMILDLVDSDYFAAPFERQEEDSPIAIQERKLPDSLKFKERFTIRDLKSPGNIHIIPAEKPGEEPRLLVPFEFNSLALITGEGKIERRMRPRSVLTDEPITFLRSALNSEGKRIYVAFSPTLTAGDRIHILDDSFESLGFYPTRREDSGNTIIFDVRLADIDDDSDPEIILSTRDLSEEARRKNSPCSIVALKLDGTEIWRTGDITDPYRLGIAYTRGEPSILAMNATHESALLYELNTKGNRTREIRHQDGFPIVWFEVEDMQGTKNSRLCAQISRFAEDTYIAELNRSGVEDWKYSLIPGVHTVPLERMIAMDLLGDSTKEWVFATPDGVLHFLDWKGKFLDRYAHGKRITGYNGAVFGGKHVLLVCDESTITAYEVED